MSSGITQGSQMANVGVSLSDDPDKVIAYYSDWATTYDKTLEPDNYMGPVLGAEEVARLIPENLRAHVRILDIGAGTGKVGVELKKRGFKHMDALEPCKEMLDILRNTKLYQKNFLEFIGLGSSTVPSDAYDVVVVVGCMGMGHIPVQGIDEMIRVAKPGGIVVNVTREEHLELPLYKNKLKPRMDQLEKEGKWKQEMWKIFPQFIKGRPALVFSYRVL